MKMTEIKGLETKELAERIESETAKEALRLGAQKLPVKTKFVVRRDYDKNA